MLILFKKLVFRESAGSWASAMCQMRGTLDDFVFVNIIIDSTLACTGSHEIYFCKQYIYFAYAVIKHAPAPTNS